MDLHGLTWLYAQKLSWIWILSTNLENPSICLVTSFSQVKNGGLLLLPVLLWLSISDAPPPRVFWVSEINQFESDDVQPRDIPIWSMRHQARRSIPVVILGVPIPIIQFWPYTWPWINKVINLAIDRQKYRTICSTWHVYVYCNRFHMWLLTSRFAR